jgi:ADP-ribose pyrophosphatase
VSKRDWHATASRLIFESQWYDLRQDDLELPDGRAATYTYVDHPGWVMVVPLLDDGRVVMEKIYRYTLRQTLLECPSGGCDGDAPEDAARRELEEETGYRAGALRPLGEFFASTGISNERFTLYLATQLSDDGVMRREPTEEIEICRLPLGELRDSVLAGEIAAGPSALAILLAWEIAGGGASQAC